MAAIIPIAAKGSAWAHGDPASHYLETDPLYPSFARQPSVEVQLQLLGLLQATARRDYPIKVALVAGAEDLVDDPAMMRRPQRYASTVAALIERELRAPVLVVTPFGLGVAGYGLRNGVRRPVTALDARRLVRGIDVPPDPQGDDLARVAMTAVRRIARDGGHRLPAHVPPAAPATPSAPADPVETVAGAQAASGGSSFPWVVPALLVPLALLVAHMRARRTPAASKA